MRRRRNGLLPRSVFLRFTDEVAARRVEVSEVDAALQLYPPRRVRHNFGVGPWEPIENMRAGFALWQRRRLG